MSFASIAVLLSLLVVLGSFALLIMNINVNLDKIASLNEIMVYCDYDLTEDEIVALEEKINSCSNISSVERITKAESLEQMKNESGDYKDLYEDINEENNPLCDSFRITYEELDEALARITKALSKE